MSYLDSNEMYVALSEEERLEIRKEIRSRESAAINLGSEKYVDQHHSERIQRFIASKEHSTNTIKMLFIINGGAIIALLTFIGSFFSRNSDTLILIGISITNKLSYSFYMFALGLVFAVIASAIAYINYSSTYFFFYSPDDSYKFIHAYGDKPETHLLFIQRAQITSRLSVAATSCSLIFFLIGCFLVARIFSVLGS